MPDYDLSRLSTRSFEQLVQALSAQILGPGLVVFGDGPDGGREATFEGKVPYPNTIAPWNGYVVVQAKFKQRSEGTTKDGKWAHAQLRGELEKFATDRRNLRKPEYYLFCINVVLSPKHGKGTKDRVARLFATYKKQLAIKDFDVWDYDKLRVFLDKSQDIRQAYAAWITPGDVLSSVIAHIDQLQPSFETNISSFLQKELLSDQFVNLDQAGHSSEEQIPMARVFVDLLATAQPSSDAPEEGAEENDPGTPGFVHIVLDAGKRRLSQTSEATQQDTRAQKVQSTEADFGRYVLIGGPGQGKTTTAQYLCQLYRVALLAEQKGGISAECRKAITLIKGQCEAEGLTIPGVRRFPIRLVLSDFAKELASGRNGAPRSVMEYLTCRIQSKTDPRFSLNDLTKWLAHYPWFVVLDGLDEVPASTNRAEVLSAIQDFWVDAAAVDADILVLATTRPQGYNREFSREFYKIRHLAPLSIDRALRYAQRLADARFGREHERGQRVMTRLRNASTVEATARLMTSPLQVTIMATLVDRAGQPPPERWRLFSEYYEVIYQREMERDHPASAILRAHKANIDGIHHRVGLELQIESERTGRTDARLSRERFAAIVQSRLESEGYVGSDLENLFRGITDAATQRLVFLVGLEADEVGFEIRSLQEFMAAEALMDGGDAKVAERLKMIAPISYWRNVFLFAAGKCFAIRQHLRDIVASVCDNLNEEGELEHMAMVGSELALDLVRDGTARQHPKYQSRLARLACRLVARPGGPVHLLLANAHEESTDVVFREELPIKSLGEVGSDISGALLTSGLLAIKDVPWATDFADRNWPKDIFQRFALLRRLRRSGHHPWLESKVEKAILQGSGLLLNAMDLASVAPKQWATVFNILSGRSEILRDFPFRLSESGTPAYFYRIATCYQPSLARAVLELPSECGSWSFLRGGAGYMMNPDKSGLATWLNASTEVVNSGSVQYLPLPWPFKECMKLIDSRHAVEEIANRASNGEFGDTEDWLAAEARWSRGVSINDIESFDRNNGVIGKYLRLAGVVSTSGHSAMHIPELDRVFAEFFKLWTRLQDRKVRSEIGSTLLFISAVQAGYSEIPGLGLEPRNILEIAESILTPDANERVDLDGPLMLASTSESPEGWLSVFDKIGVMPRISYWGPPTDKTIHVASVIRDAFIADRSRRGLARILGMISQTQTSKVHAQEFRIPMTLLENLHWEEAEFRATLIKLSLAQPGVSPEFAGRLAEGVAANERDVTGIVEDSLRIASRTLDTSALESFVVTLARFLQPSGWETRSRVLDAVEEILRERRSGLHSPSVRMDLQLPGAVA
jgi:hypothetical protein